MKKAVSKKKKRLIKLAHPIRQKEKTKIDPTTIERVFNKKTQTWEKVPEKFRRRPSPKGLKVVRTTVPMTKVEREKEKALRHKLRLLLKPNY